VQHSEWDRIGERETAARTTGPRGHGLGVLTPGSNLAGQTAAEPRGLPGSGGLGRGGPGGMTQKETKILELFDRDGNGRLNQEERQAARVYLSEQQSHRAPGGFGGRRGGFGRPGESEEAAQPRVKIPPGEVKSYPGVPAYDPLMVRTFFLEFENADWEQELAAFKNTDVEVPAKLVVDGKEYEEVGVQFRGQSSYIAVEAYRRLYEIKTKDNEESWGALIRWCKVLNQTPPDELEQALSPILDIDGTLKFLALENVMVNSDGRFC
jgi:hypothetical protein